MHKLVMAVAVEMFYISLKLGAKSLGHGSQDILSIKKVTWDKLLASKAEIIHK